MFEYENLTVSKLSLVLKTGCYSQREFMFTFQKYFFFGTKTYFVYVCVTERKKKLSRAALPSSASLTLTLTPPSCVSASLTLTPPYLLPPPATSPSYFRFAAASPRRALTYFWVSFFFHVTVCV